MSFFKSGRFSWPKFYRLRANNSVSEVGGVEMHRICIAANPDFERAGTKHRWLVTDNGETRGASEVVVNAGFDPSTDMQGHEVNVVYVCLGKVSWRGSIAEIN